MVCYEIFQKKRASRHLLASFYLGRGSVIVPMVPNGIICLGGDQF